MGTTPVNGHEKDAFEEERYMEKIHQTRSPQATNPLLISSNPCPTLLAQPSNVASRLTSTTSSLDRLPGSQTGLKCKMTCTHEGVKVIARCECGSGKVLFPEPRERVMIDVGRVKRRSSIRAQGFLSALIGVQMGERTCKR